jgi:hypothetical protein
MKDEMRRRSGAETRQNMVMRGDWARGSRGVFEPRLWRLEPGVIGGGFVMGNSDGTWGDNGQGRTTRGGKGGGEVRRRRVWQATSGDCGTSSFVKGARVEHLQQ